IEVDHLSPASAAMEAQDQLAVVLAKRVLELVAIAPRTDGGLDRLELEAVQAAEPAKRLVDLPRLLLELALVRKPLPGSARTRLTLVEASIRDPVDARLDELDGARLAEVALGLLDPGPDPIARQPAGHEDDIAVRT